LKCVVVTAVKESTTLPEHDAFKGLLNRIMFFLHSEIAKGGAR